MQISPNYFAEALRVLMQKQGISTQRELASLFEVTPPTVNLWLKPKSRRDIPGDDVLPKIAELSGYDLEKLKLYKKLLKWQAEGLDMEALKNSVIALSDDQAAVVDLMTHGDYVGAAQFLLSRARLTA